MPLLKLKNIHCRDRNGNPVLKGVDGEIYAGEIRALLGAAGAGKSTLLMTISGLRRPFRGEIVFRGREISRWSPAEIVRAGLCQVPEGGRIFPELTVAENLAMGAWGRRDHSQVAQDMEMAYELFPVLREARKEPGGKLLRAERLQLAIARGLLARPRLLLLDEPSRGLPPSAVNQIFTIIEKLAGEGITILLAEENVDAALNLADYGYVLESGRIKSAAPAAELRRDGSVGKTGSGVQTRPSVEVK